MRSAWLCGGLCLGLWACGDEASSLDGGASADAGVLDARAGDAAVADAGARDAGPAVDAGAADAGFEDVGPLGWSAAAPLAGGPRQETAVVAWRGEVVVIGGYDETQSFGVAVEAYDPGTDAWRALPDLPTPMHHANAAVVGDDLWVVGFLKGGFVQDGRIFVLEDGASSWAARGEMPAARARGSSVTLTHEGAIYLVGGLGNVAPVAHVDRFDPATGDWRSLPPIPRLTDHAVGGVIDGKLYVAGGRAGLIGAHVPDLDVLDLVSFEWSKGPAMPTSRGGAAGAVLGGALFVIGGEGNASNPPTNLFDAVESFDVAEGAWRVHDPMSPARHGMGAAAIGGRIFVPGGADVQAFGAVSQHQILGP